MNVNLFLQKTAMDSIALWTPDVLSTSQFLQPIVLSTGVGIERFITIDPVPQNAIIKPSLNRNVIRYMKPVVITGTCTFHPQSTALSALREITEYQYSSGLAITGTMIVINIGALQFDKYTGVSWNNPYSGSNRERVLSDVNMSFSSNKPNAISLGFVESILAAI